jgi:uncharacterized protein with HEPN domain
LSHTPKTWILINFRRELLHIDAVLHNLQIIGEAVKQLPEDIRLQDPEIKWRKVAGLRDIVAHQYFSISLEIVWDVLQNHLPEFGKRNLRFA